jgi:hypothetical protein
MKAKLLEICYNQGIESLKGMMEKGFGRLYECLSNDRVETKERCLKYLI